MDTILEKSKPASYLLTDNQILVLAQETAKATVEELRKQQEPDRIISREELKKITGIKSNTTIIKLEKQGLITRSQVGGKICYKLSHVRSAFREKVAV